MQPGKNHGGGTGNNRTINDSHFVDELRNNSNRAWSKLLAEFWEPMRLMALRICGPHTPEADIEDILQETLLGAFQNIDRFRGDSAFSTFLLGILRHKASDYIAAKRCLNKLAFRAMPRQVFRQNEHFEHPDPRLGLADCLRELIAAERPRSPRRQALQLIKNILADSQDIPSLKEMARLWGCSPKHAKWLWHDAKRSLKQRYRESTVDANYPRKHSEMQAKTPLMPLTHPTHAAPVQHPCSTKEDIVPHMHSHKSPKSRRNAPGMSHASRTPPAPCPSAEEIEHLLAGRITDLPRMTDIEHHVQTCHDCHAQAQAIESLLHREAGLAHVPTSVPRRIIDLPYVVGVQDLTSYITRAYTPRRLAIEPLLVIVPDFFKAPIFPSGLLPQQYLARIITILAEILPRNDTLTIDANTTSFIITSLATHSEYHVTQQTIRCETSDRTTTARTDLFLAFYTLWTIPSTLIPASAAALPMPQAQRVRSESTASNLAQLDQFFGTHSHTRRPAPAHLVGIARYLSQNNYPPQLILEPPSSAPHMHPRVPLPELFAGLPDPEKSRWPDILAAIRRAANEE